MISIFVSSAEQPIRSIDLAELPEHLEAARRGDEVLWVDLEAPTEEEEQSILGGIFKLHHLAIRDVRHEHLEGHSGDHLPKVEDYGDYLFSIINPIDIGEQAEASGGTIVFDVQTRQINVFLGESFIVTHHYEPSKAITDARSSCEKNPQLFSRGPDFIYHLILDDIVSNYSPVLDQFDEAIEALEDAVFHRNATNRTLAMILAMKRTVFRMRRITTYQREMVFRLSRGEFALVTQDEIAYYRNVYDHLERATDLTESYRDVLTGLLDAYMSMSATRLNEVMKVLTIISTFFLPLTFVAGVYGMNFEHMPELHWKYGYLFAWGIMAAISVVMFVYFRRKKWI
jgi:magnesium transporter